MYTIFVLTVFSVKMIEVISLLWRASLVTPPLTESNSCSAKFIHWMNTAIASINTTSYFVRKSSDVQWTFFCRGLDKSEDNQLRRSQVTDAGATPRLIDEGSTSTWHHKLILLCIVIAASLLAVLGKTCPTLLLIGYNQTLTSHNKHIGPFRVVGKFIWWL